MKRPIPLIYNNPFVNGGNLVRIATIDDYSSFIWTTRYSTTGDFQLIVDVKPEYIDLFEEDQIVLREDAEEAGLIESIQLETTEDGEDRFVIKGRFVDSVIGRRIISLAGTVSASFISVDVMISTELYYNAVGAGTAENRRLQGVSYGGYTGLGLPHITGQFTGKNLLAVIEDLCKICNIGHKTVYDDGTFKFKLYQGKDRTYDQTENERVIFSDKYDNLLSSQFLKDYQNMVTSVLVFGKDYQGDATWAGNDKSSWGRREAFRNETSLKKDTLTDEQYQAQLIQIGKNYITTYTSSFSGSVVFDSYEFRKDVNVGDICVIENTKWGLSFKARLMEVIESVDETGNYSAIPTFGIIQ